MLTPMVLNLIAFVLAFVMVVISIPTILRVARAKNLFDQNNYRKVHKNVVPSVGGIAIFIGFIISALIATDGYTFEEQKYIVAAIILLFFVGLKDDILVITPWKKFIVQLIAIVLVITLGNIRFTNLQGIFQIHEISYSLSFFLTLIFMLGVVNAYNFIDGIDGLAAALGMLASFMFGIWFFLSGNIPDSVMSFALGGSLAAFFIYNVFGKNDKIFMGDTGSMIIGLVISVIAVHFNELNIQKDHPWSVFTAPTVSFSILIVPLIDMVRVMVIRLFARKSPFVADMNHIHHKLLLLQGNHLKVTLTLVLVNCLFVAAGLAGNYYRIGVQLQLFILVITGFTVSVIPEIILSRRQRSEVPVKRLFEETDEYPERKHFHAI